MSSSAEYIEEYKRVILPSTISENEDKVLCKGDGVWVWDEDGKKYFDAASQVSMVNIGHNHPKLISWTRKYYAKAAREKIITSSINTDCYARSFLTVDGERMEISPPGLQRRLAQHTFGPENTICFPDVTGALGTNDALRYFRTVTGRPYWLTFEKAFHGRHGEARDSSDSNPIHWNEAERDHHAYRLPYPETKEGLKACLEKLKSLNLKVFSYLLYEPVQGEGGGMRVGRYIKEVEDFLKTEGVYSISDEIQAGMGRCGEWFGYQALGLNPDAIVLGKSLGVIVPVSCFVLKKGINDLYNFPHGKISGTFPGYNAGMAAANFVMRIYEEEKIVENARNLSPEFGKMLKNAIEPYDILNLHNMRLPSLKVDGIGLYRSIKFYDKNGIPDPKMRDLVNLKLRELGVWTYPASKSFPAIRFTPPLVSTQADLKFLTDAIYQATRILYQS